MNRNKRTIVPMNGNGKTKLDFMLNIPMKRKSGVSWNVDNARKIVDFFQNAKSLKEMTRKDQYLELAKMTGFSKFGCMAFTLELRRAAKHGYDLETYFEKNRPLRLGKKVVA